MLIAMNFSPPERDGQDHDRHKDADQLAVTASCLVGVAKAGVILHLDTHITKTLHGLLGRIELSGVDLLDVEPDRGEGGLPVGADRRTARGS